MAQERKRKRIAVRTVPCDTLMYDSESGEKEALRAEETVTFFRHFPMRVLKLAGQLEGLEEGVDLREMAPLFESICGILAKYIVRWTWRDLLEDFDNDSEEPIMLAQPRRNPDAIWDLSDDELLWLLDALIEGTSVAKNS